MNTRFSKFLKISACGLVAFLLFGFAVMLLWNWLIPEIFDGPEINFIQALGILILSKILFSGFGGRCHCENQGNKHYWKQKFFEKMKRMNPEEREHFKNKFGRCFESHETPSKPEQ